MERPLRSTPETYDPFGAPLATQPASSTEHLFAGRWNKQYDTTSSLILMGARPYDPNLGRFLAVDPVDGGSLNNYDYAGQDPVNGYDLDGRSWWCNSETRKCKYKDDGADTTTCWTERTSDTGWLCILGLPLSEKAKKNGAAYEYDVTTTPAGGDYPSPSSGYHCVVYKNGTYECDAWGDEGHSSVQHAAGVVCSKASYLMSIPGLGRFWGSVASNVASALGCASNAR